LVMSSSSPLSSRISLRRSTHHSSPQCNFSGSAPYGVTAYNYWTQCNDPNRTTTDPDPYCHHQGSYDPSRPPFGDLGVPPDYPYQEYIWGWMAHPERARALPTPWLWRPTNLAAVPRGIFGLSGSWAPPSGTTLALVHLLPDIRVANGVEPSIVLRNTDPNRILAVDIGADPEKLHWGEL